MDEFDPTAVSSHKGPSYDPFISNADSKSWECFDSTGISKFKIRIGHDKTLPTIDVGAKLLKMLCHPNMESHVCEFFAANKHVNLTGVTFPFLTYVSQLRIKSVVFYCDNASYKHWPNTGDNIAALGLPNPNDPDFSVHKASTAWGCCRAAAVSFPQFAAKPPMHIDLTAFIPSLCHLCKSPIVGTDLNAPCSKCIVK